MGIEHGTDPRARMSVSACGMEQAEERLCFHETGGGWGTEDDADPIAGISASA